MSAQTRGLLANAIIGASNVAPRSNELAWVKSEMRGVVCEVSAQFVRDHSSAVSQACRIAVRSRDSRNCGRTTTPWRRNDSMTIRLRLERMADLVGSPKAPRHSFQLTLRRRASAKRGLFGNGYGSRLPDTATYERSPRISNV